jgi:putative DNA primase/helicase
VQSPDTQDVVAQFRDAMTAAGVPYSGTIEADGVRHRFQVDTDKRGKKNGWLILHLDGKPAGAFGTWKGVTCKWSAEGAAPLTRDERDQIREASARKREAAALAEAEQHAKSAERAEAMWDAAQDADQHAYLTRKGISAHGLRIGDWVKERQDGTTYVAAKGALLIPLRDATKKIWSLQAIFAKPITVAGEERDKDFVYGGRKKGCWTVIGKPTDVDGQVTVVICEGYATGASIHQATGLAVIVAFDAKNLGPVAAEARRLMPGARIVIAADNDEWTTKPDKVTRWNPGVEAATAVAKSIDGVLAIPYFEDVSGKPTDFNDLHALLGLAEVNRQIMDAICPAPAEKESSEEIPPWDGPTEFMEHVDPDDNGYAGPTVEEDDKDTDGFFRVLGHDREQIYVYQYRMKLIISRAFTDWGEAALWTLAPLNWWEQEFTAKVGMNKKAAHNWLIRQAEKKGFFDPDCRRGRGAWRDDGRVVYHFGDRLMIDGDLRPDLKITSNSVYEQSRKLRVPADESISSADGKKILAVAQGFAWTRPASALLWVGWCALAPLCGALAWRPHIWITGGAGSGKSTILDMAHWLMNGCSIYAQGNSTEAGIRQTLRIDALPVLFDESEQNNEREAMRIQGVIALIRQSSTESAAKTLKGTQGGSAMDFNIRSMFHLSSIQVGMKHQADFDRLSILSLRPRRDDPNAAESWQRLSGMLAELRADANLPARLMRRSLELLPITIQNIEIFAQAGTEAFGSRRDGDQYGALLAGAWSLVSTRLATLDDARSMIKRYDWSDYLENSDTEESSKALATLMGALVHWKGGDIAIGTLVSIAAGQFTNGLGKSEAIEMLKDRGIRVEVAATKHGNREGELWVSYDCHARDQLLKDTPYRADLKGQLLRVRGARRSGKNARFGPYQQGGYVAIPLHAVIGDTLNVDLGDADIDDHVAF